MQPMVCVHYLCPRCGDQKHCLDSKLRDDESLVCSTGHNYLVGTRQREKINAAFDGSFEAEVDVYLTAGEVTTVP